MENGINIYGLYEYQFKEGNNSLKWLYEQNYNEFVRKFKLGFPKADDAEINFFLESTSLRILIKKANTMEHLFLIITNFFGMPSLATILKHLMIMNMAG